MPKYSSLKALQTDLREGKISCTALVDYYLKQIEAQKDLNIYIEVFAKEARAKAAETDKILRENPEKAGKLFGAVVSIKDVLAFKDHKVSAASKILQGYTSLFSATAIERIVAEGAIIIGRTNCDQFGMGSTNENSFYGPTRNALDPERVPGGSSGGAAVAVQADTCLVALGTDTGGSVRQPAAFCGIVGMKPGYGRISRHGLLAYASSFDQVGILANSVEDVARMLEIMAGADEFDSTCSTQSVPKYSEALSFGRKAKICYFNTAINHPSLDPVIKTQTENLLHKLKTDGHEVLGLDFDLLDYIIPAYYVLTTAEASSNLSRYDGVRFGYRSQEAGNLMETYKKSRTEGFSTEVKRRIMLGTFVLSAGFYDAYYSKAQKVRRLIREKTLEIFREFDFILMPSAPSTAWKIGEMSDDPVAMYLADIYTVQANMAGIPAINVPLGKGKDGMPTGIQVLAGILKESELLAFSELLCGVIAGKEIK